jgi:hypothetical protein
VGCGLLGEQLRRAHDHAGRAVAALEPVLLPEAGLERVQRAGLAQRLDRRHLVAVDVHRAGPAQRGLAADVRAREREVLAQEVHEQLGPSALRCSSARR